MATAILKEEYTRIYTVASAGAWGIGGCVRASAGTRGHRRVVASGRWHRRSLWHAYVPLCICTQSPDTNSARSMLQKQLSIGQIHGSCCSCVHRWMHSGGGDGGGGGGGGDDAGIVSWCMEKVGKIFCMTSWYNRFASSIETRRLQKQNPRQQLW